jgi:hypothetical protein
MSDAEAHEKGRLMVILGREVPLLTQELYNRLKNKELQGGPGRNHRRVPEGADRRGEGGTRGASACRAAPT